MIKFLKTLWQALLNMFNDLSIDIAGYIAYTSLLALFPFIMLLLSLAGYMGATENVKLAIQQFYEVLPEQIVHVISPIINDITLHPPSGVLTILIIAILWISSSSIEAIREGLNHAYLLKERRSFFMRRAQAIVFVILGSCAFLLASTLLIFLPIAFDLWFYIGPYLRKIPSIPQEYGFKTNNYALLGAFLVIFFSLISMYRWLPYHKIKLGHTLPGALVSSSLWIMMAGLFSLYLRNIAQYDLIYGSLGGVIVTLIFFHLTAMLILYGAHINRVLNKD